MRRTRGSSSSPLVPLTRSASLPHSAARRHLTMRVRVSLLCIGLLCGALGAAAQSVSLAARSRGVATAPITVYEMSDFQCPYCREFALTTMPVLDKEYVATGKVRFIYITLPLSRIHANAKVAAEVALCAAEQGRFWPVHDRLFLRQETWADLKDPVLYLIALADSAGADSKKLASCVGTPASIAAVDADSAAAVRTGAHSTPSFYVEGGLIEGVAPTQVFREVLDSIYRAKTKPAR